MRVVCTSGRWAAWAGCGLPHGTAGGRVRTPGTAKLGAFWLGRKGASSVGGEAVLDSQGQGCAQGHSDLGIAAVHVVTPGSETCFFPYNYSNMLARIGTTSQSFAL